MPIVDHPRSRRTRPALVIDSSFRCCGATGVFRGNRLQERINDHAVAFGFHRYRDADARFDPRRNEHDPGRLDDEPDSPTGNDPRVLSETAQASRKRPHHGAERVPASSHLDEDLDPPVISVAATRASKQLITTRDLRASARAHSPTMNSLPFRGNAQRLNRFVSVPYSAQSS